MCRWALLGALVALVAAGCGDEEDSGAASGSGTTELEVTLDSDGPQGEPPRTETVACEAGTGDSPCAGLAVTDLAPLDPATPCTEIYGGPDTLQVEGTLDGEPATAAFTRANGCEIDRFDRFMALLRELFPGYEPGEALSP